MATATPTRKRQRKTYSAPALEKGLDIIELLANEGQPLATPAIAARLNRSIGEIFRMIVVLEQRGYITTQGDDRFVLTLKLFELAARDAPVNRLTSAAVDVMHRLAEDTQQSCHLAIHGNGRSIVVAQENSPAWRGLSVRLGAEAPLMQSCSGHLLLAYADPESRQQMLDAQPRHFGRRAGKTTVQRMTERVLKHGYESVKSAQVAGVRDIGYPVFNHSGRMTAALVIPFLEHVDGSQAVSFEDCRTRLAQAANDISSALGYAPDSRAPNG